ncbi:MAG: helix-turn-helix transcriptional regulator [Bacteroidaceae bacterium]|nr:helix-turn-helix transcriptional regulator [Bacteroidaceae bacterium]
MSKNYSKIYIGKIIQAKVNERGLGYAEFARRINCARTSIYSLFNSKSIDVERLLRISDVLEYDFINEVYKKNTFARPEEYPSIHFVLKNGTIDFSHLPKELLALIKEQINNEL